MVNSQRSTVNGQQSKYHGQKSTVNSQQSTVKSQRAIVNSQQSTVKSQCPYWLEDKINTQNFSSKLCSQF